MKEFHLFYAPELPHSTALPPDEANHAVRVLRMQEGDELLATDGRGTFYRCTITLASRNHCAVDIVDSRPAAPLWQGGIHLAVAPTKSMDRMEWLAEKATEVGLDALTFVDCHNSERHVVKPERVERIVVAAMKQSHKALKPEVEGMTPFGRFIARPFEGQRFIAHCYNMPDVTDDAPSAEGAEASPFLGDVVGAEGNALVLIGPEGDFSLDEVRAAVAAGFKPISLGDSRLRTETAALVAVHLMNLAKRRGR